MNYQYLIASIIFVAGILLFFYFARKKKYRTSQKVERYEPVRKKLTIREEAQEEVEEIEEETSFLSVSLPALFGVLISLVLMIYVIMIVSQTLGSMLNEATGLENNAALSANVTTSVEVFSSTVIDIFPLLLVVIVAIAIIIFLKDILFTEGM